eukprot:2467597-Prymnesium_polylepis.1
MPRCEQRWKAAGRAAGRSRKGGSRALATRCLLLHCSGCHAPPALLPHCSRATLVCGARA